MPNNPINSIQSDTHNYITNNIRWLIKDISLDILKEMLDSIDRKNNCEIIHNGYFKRVLKYTGNQQSFYIKQYTTRNTIDAVKSLFLVSKAQREWNKSHLLLRNNLLTAEPVAVGEKRRFGILKECFIISKAIPHSTSVKDLLFDIQQSSTNSVLSKKNSLIKNLISYVKTMHEYGIVHGELHAENILVDPNNVTAFYLLDLGRAKFTRKIPLSWRIRELSRLIYSIVDTCTNEEIKELIDNYTNQLVESKNRVIFHKAVFKEVYSIKHRLWNSRTKKCLKNNNVFKVTKHNNYTINMRNEWGVNTLLALIDKHALSLKERLDNIIKVSHKIGITCVPAPNGNIKSVCIKEYKYSSRFKRFFFFLCGSPARKAWLGAHGLMALNLRTPKPIALVEEKKLARVEKVSSLWKIFQLVYHATNTSAKNLVILVVQLPSEEKRFISYLAQSFRQLHDSNVYHADLKANNIMIMELPDSWNFFIWI